MECEKSPNGKHDPFVPDGAISRSTCMTGPNSGSTTVRCSWCGIRGDKFWHEEYRQLKNRGPYATTLVQVQDKIEWNSPR